MGQLRQLIVGELEAPAAEIPIGLETLTAALGPLTMTERQAAWLETMRYPAAQAGPMLRVSPDTVEKVRGRAAELIRGHVDSWRRTLLTENGPALGREAAGGIGGGLPAHQGVPGRGGRAHDVAGQGNDGAASARVLALRGSFLPDVGSGTSVARQ